MEVFVQHWVIRGAELWPYLCGLGRNRFQHALLLLQTCVSLRSCAGLAEHPLESDSRVDAHRQRARIVAPRERIKENAGEPIAGAGGRSHVLGSEFNRA